MLKLVPQSPAASPDAADPLAALDFDPSLSCDWCPDVALVDPPRHATWVTTTRPLPCGHIATRWVVCGHCLTIAIRGHRGGRPQRVVHCGNAIPLNGWMTSYRPIEQPTWLSAAAR